MDFPKVKITDLSDTDVLPEGGKGVNLGNAEMEAQLDGILAKFKASASKVFLLQWKGGKIPRGAQICGQDIAWTQHGIVRAKGGEEIGTYERLAEFEGKDNNEQRMLVFVQ